jgi:hypothetical protein
MKKFLVPVLGLFLAFGVFSVFSPDLVMAQWNSNGLIDANDSPDNIKTATGEQDSFRAIARTIVNFILYFLGLIATIMIIYGGFLYITSGGEETEKAKKVLMYAAIGIVVILISFALVNTLLQAAEEVAPPTNAGGAYIMKIVG